VFFPENIKFKNENYVAIDEVTEHYDAIFCLSVSKWVQLNWGDEGIKKMFRKVSVLFFLFFLFFLTGD
jgi:7SK snRNA methylphosphate capping enzyme